MKYNDIKESVLAQFAMPEGHKVVFYIQGKPGGGKSSVAREIARELQKLHNIADDRVIEFNPSLRDPTDILGLPQMDGECSKWLPPQEFYDIRKGTGPAVLIVEEISDASMDMQNPLCRVLLDRYAGQMPLTDKLFVIATGNRTEDRSGACRLSTKLGNRMRSLLFEEDLEDWIAWARRKGIDPVLQAFLKWRPALLADFDPTKTVNPTPRSWEDVSRIPTTLKQNLYFEHVKGAVGDGAAAEYCGFRKIYDELPDLSNIKKNPAKAKLPKGADILYALCAKFLVEAEKLKGQAASDFLNELWPFISRMPAEFVVMVVKSVIEMPRETNRAFCLSPAFKDFAKAHGSLL